MSGKGYLVISGTVFSVVAVAHLLRAIYHWQFQIGTVILPVWVSWVGLLVAGALGIWAFRLAAK